MTSLLPLAIAVLALAIPPVACARAPEPASRPVVAVTVAPQAFFVERLAGDRVEIAVMVPPGANPATWQPGLVEERVFARAALYVKVGHPHLAFERAWIEPRLAERPTRTVVEGAEDTGPGDDPHVWLAPSRARRSVRALHAALVALLPEDEAELDARLADLLAEIDALDAEIRRILAGRQGARFWVFHPAWGSFAREYGLEQVAIEHENKEPDPRRLAALIRKGRDEKVRVVFVQPQFSAQSAELVAREIGARVEILDPLARDWAANLRRTAQRLAEATSG